MDCSIAQLGAESFLEQGRAAQCKSGSLIKWEVLVETQNTGAEEVRRIVRKKPLRLVFQYSERRCWDLRRRPGR